MLSSGDFYLLNGEPFYGQYEKSGNKYVTSTGDVLISKNRLDTEIYRARTSMPKSGYTPEPYYINPASFDYYVGNIQRFFVQKKNNPTGTIVEVSQEHYELNGFSEKVLSAATLYRGIEIEWVISGDAQYCANKNSKSVLDADKIFSGIKEILSDPLQFWKK